MSHKLIIKDALAFIQEEKTKKKLLLVDAMEQELKAKESSYELGYRKGIELKSIQFGGWCMKNLVRKGQGFVYTYARVDEIPKPLEEFYNTFIQEME